MVEPTCPAPQMITLMAIPVIRKCLASSHLGQRPLISVITVKTILAIAFLVAGCTCQALPNGIPATLVTLGES